MMLTDNKGSRTRVIGGMRWLALCLAVVSAAACGGDEAGSGGAGGAGGGETVGDGDFYAPAAIATRLTETRSVTWTEISADLVDLQRFALGPAGGDALVVVEDAGNTLSGLALTDGLTSATTLDNDLLLRATFKLVSSPGGYRVVSTKHANYAWDAEGSAVVMRDIRSVTAPVGEGYLVFEQQGDTLVAVGRQLLASDGSYAADPAWSGSQALVVETAGLSLGTTGTSLVFREEPIDFTIPYDFNPDDQERVPNSEFRPSEVESDRLQMTLDELDAAYADQVSTSGPDPDTRSAASTMLEAIATTLAAEGASLRYPQSLYLAFRDGLLARTELSADAWDSELGQHTVPFVYFTNVADDSGVHHPFMVIASYNLPDSLSLLYDVTRPPGDGIAGQYPDQQVTRHYHSEGFLVKVPLRDYGLIESLTENVMVADLASDVGETAFDTHNHSSVSAAGVAIDGVIIYPAYNNTLQFAQSAAELSAHGMHSGRGLGVHYHADSHSAKADGLSLYNAGDYQGHSHPPLISFGFDGVAGYGAYTDGSALDGADVPLDEYGGHTHAGYGYHYHTVISSETSVNGNAYTVHSLPPLGAWKGRINDIPEFWDMRAPQYVATHSSYLGTE